MTVLPMFPLGTVLFPSVVLPLHVFEERYRVLTRHCLDGDRRFGVVLIERGSEVGGGDVRTDVGTVAEIVEATRFDDGRYALGTVGVGRLRVIEWLDDEPYPRAEVEPWDDPAPDDDLPERLAAVVRRLRTLLARAAELGQPVPAATAELAEDPVLATYQAAALLPVGPADKQRLLATPTPDARVRALDELVEEELRVADQMLGLGPPPDDLRDDGPS
jgi:Lon protease-like protein